MLQAYDSIATTDFTLIVPEDEVSSEQLLFNLDMKPEKDEIIVAVENHEIEEMEVEKYSDMDDEKNTRDSTVLVVTINDEQSSSSDETEEIDGIGGNKIKENSDMETSLVTVVDTRNVDMRNENADAFHLNLTMTNNKESTFDPVVTDETIDNEMDVMESVQNVHVTRSDNKEHVKETIVHVEGHKEEGMMAEASDNAVRTIRMFRNSRETLVSKSLKCHNQTTGNY